MALCQSFLRLGLVDEIRLSIILVLLCYGPRLFDNYGIERSWHRKNVIAYKTGDGVVSAANPLTPP